MAANKKARASKSPVRRKEKKRPFGLQLFFFAILLLLLFLFALMLLFRFLSVYEVSQSKYCVEEYLNELHENPCPEEAKAALAGLDPLICSPEESEAVIRPMLAECRLVKDPARCVEGETLVYQIVGTDKTVLGEVQFSVTGTREYELPIWEKTSASFDFSSYYQTTQVVVPVDYQVFLGDRQLGPDNVIETGIPYDTLADYYPLYEGLPTMVRYESGPFLGEPTLHVCDETGAEIPAEQWTEERFLQNCAREDREAVEEFISRFLPLFIYYSADMNHNAMSYYRSVLELTVPDSPLSNRITQAVGSFGYTNTRALDIQSMDVNFVIDLGGGRYLADVTYVTDVTGMYVSAVSENNVRLVVMEYGGVLLGDALFYY